MGQLEYDLVDDDYIAYNLHLAATSPAIRRQIDRGRWIGTVVVVVLGTAVFGLLEGAWVTGLVLGVVVAVVMWFGWPRFARRSVTAQLRRLSRQGALGRTGPVRLRWDDTGLHEDAIGASATAEWSRVDRVEETAEHLFLFLGPLEALVVPRRAGGAVVTLAQEARTRTAQGGVSPGA